MPRVIRDSSVDFILPNAILVDLPESDPTFGEANSTLMYIQVFSSEEFLAMGIFQ